MLLDRNALAADHNKIHVHARPLGIGGRFRYALQMQSTNAVAYGHRQECVCRTRTNAEREIRERKKATAKDQRNACNAETLSIGGRHTSIQRYGNGKT